VPLAIRLEFFFGEFSVFVRVNGIKCLPVQVGPACLCFFEGQKSFVILVTVFKFQALLVWIFRTPFAINGFVGGQGGSES